MAHHCNPRTWELRTGGPGQWGHPQIQIKWEILSLKTEIKQTSKTPATKQMKRHSTTHPLGSMEARTPMKEVLIPTIMTIKRKKRKTQSVMSRNWSPVCCWYSIKWSSHSGKQIGVSRRIKQNCGVTQKIHCKVYFSSTFFCCDKTLWSKTT